MADTVLRLRVSQVQHDDVISPASTRDSTPRGHHAPSRGHVNPAFSQSPCDVIFSQTSSCDVIEQLPSPDVTVSHISRDRSASEACEEASEHQANQANTEEDFETLRNQGLSATSEKVVNKALRDVIKGKASRDQAVSRALSDAQLDETCPCPIF